METVMDAAALAEIVTAMQRAGLSVLELDGPAGMVRLRLLEDAAPSPAPAVIPVHCMAPAAGVLHLAHPMQDAPLAATGARVGAGETIALIRTGLLLRPVTAPADGVLHRWLAEDGALVSYGAPLAEIAAE